jgi:hypothetical protein
MMRSENPARRLTPAERAKKSRWVRHVKDIIRAGLRDKRDDALVRGDEDLAHAIIDFSSVAIEGWTWPGEKRLAKILNESDRNVRKRIARLRAMNLLIVIPPSDGWASNRYVPVLDGHPLFEVALASEQVRDGIEALQRQAGDYTGMPVPPQSTVETGTPVPPDEASPFQQRRNACSAESCSNNPKKSDSPASSPTDTPTAPTQEDDRLDWDLQEERPEPALEGKTDSTEKPATFNGCPKDDQPKVRAEPDRAEQSAAPVVEFSFGRLMRDYRHPPGDRGIEHQA